MAERIPLHLVAATGYYTADVLPLYFQFHGPGRLIDEPDPLAAMFIRDIEEGIAGTAVRAGMIKVMTGPAGWTPDVVRVMTAAAMAHARTGVTITTHSVPETRNGLEQQAFLREHGVPAHRIVIGHSRRHRGPGLPPRAHGQRLDDRDGSLRHGARPAG